MRVVGEAANGKEVRIGRDLKPDVIIWTSPCRR